MNIRVAVAVLLLSGAAGMTADELTAPAVTMQIVPRRPGGIDTSDPAKARIPMALVVVNASPRTLTGFMLSADAASRFRVSAPPRFPAALGPFTTFAGAVELAPTGAVPYGKHDVVLLLQYRWTAGNAQYTSALPATASIELKRLFAEETSALPGGTASLFYLLLPLFPAFFFFQFIDRLRRGEGPQVPVFSSDYLLPAFCIGLLVNYFVGGRYGLVAVLGTAAVIGAAWPAFRWGWEALQQRRWGFTPADQPEQYLRKVLLARRRPHGDQWVTAKAGGETWRGVLLAQPNGRPVLGSRLLVSNVTDATLFEQLQSLAKAGAADRHSRVRLYEEVIRRKLPVAALENVVRGDQPHPDLVATAELVRFEIEKVERRQFVEITT